MHLSVSEPTQKCKHDQFVLNGKLSDGEAHGSQIKTTIRFALALNEKARWCSLL